MNHVLLVDGDEDTDTYMPMNTFTTVDLGCERGNNLTNMITRMFTSRHPGRAAENGRQGDTGKPERV